MKIIHKKSFDKAYAKLSLSLQQKTQTTILLFAQDPFHSKLHNHQLKGTLSNYRSMNVTGDLRIIFRECSSGLYELVELVDLGTHSQLYG